MSISQIKKHKIVNKKEGTDSLYDKINEFENIFQLFDDDQDGFINENDFKILLKIIGVDEKKNKLKGLICIDTHGTKAFNYAQMKIIVQQYLNYNESSTNKL